MKENVPLMIEFLFGESAPTAHRIASERLLLWSQAFDAWLVELRQRYSSSRPKTAVAAWRSLLHAQRKPPWELLPADMAQHIAWMEAQGYTPGTISGSLRVLSDFYRWCAERELEPRLTNPVEDVSIPKARRYAQANLLSRAELQALLGILARDESPVGRRDHAFFLARLSMGIPLEDLRRLQWGQIMDGEDALVQGRLHYDIPCEVRQAILAYLGASGRLAGMQAGMSVFAPQADSVKDAMGSRATDWRADRSISYNQLLKSLKLYGGLVKIPTEKLNLNVLRYTAIRLRLDQGASLEQMRAFIGSRLHPLRLASLLRYLPPLPEGDPQAEQLDNQAMPPNRQPKLLQLGDGVTHGLYARRQPSEAVNAMMALDIQGMDEELEMLQILLDGLMERFERDPSAQDVIHLVDAYSQACVKMAGLEKAVRELGKEKGNPRSRNFRGQPDTAPLEIEARREFEAIQQEKRAGKRGPAETIASLRVMLRKTFTLALEDQDDARYIDHVGIYGTVCKRMLKLMRLGGDEEKQFEEYKLEVLNDVLTQLFAEGFMK
jgi:hypothetical protein